MVHVREALNDSTHYKHQPHAMLMSFRTTQGNVSLHHNLLFSSRDRHPTLGGGDPARSSPQAIFDFRQNVIYNWEGACNLATGVFNLENNFWRPGPDTRPYDKAFPVAPKAEAQDVTRGRLAGNVFEGQEAWTKDNYAAFQWGTRGGKYVGEVTRDKFIIASDPVMPADRRPSVAGRYVRTRARPAGACLPETKLICASSRGSRTAATDASTVRRRSAAGRNWSQDRHPLTTTRMGWRTSGKRPKDWTRRAQSDRDQTKADGRTMLEHYLAYLAGDGR
jgi:hypothetical protein